MKFCCTTFGVSSHDNTAGSYLWSGDKPVDRDSPATHRLLQLHLSRSVLLAHCYHDCRLRAYHLETVVEQETGRGCWTRAEDVWQHQETGKHFIARKVLGMFIISQSIHIVFANVSFSSSRRLKKLYHIKVQNGGVYAYSFYLKLQASSKHAASVWQGIFQPRGECRWLEWIRWRMDDLERPKCITRKNCFTEPTRKYYQRQNVGQWF